MIQTPVRQYRHDVDAVLCAFDLLELDGEVLRRTPIETRKLTLKSLLRGKRPGLAFNEHFAAEGEMVYRQACALGCEGIVSKRLGCVLSFWARRLLGEGKEPSLARNEAGS
jgi:bifunctional non-homologous end joining protein LigD